MKFPYELSKQRQSLMSNEDRRQYLIEHSEFYSYTEREQAIREYQKALLERQGYYINEINNDEEYNVLDETEKTSMANELALYESSIYLDELADILEECVGDVLTKEEYSQMRTYIKDSLLNEDMFNENSLNEDFLAPGHDITHWIPDLGWLGKLTFGLLSGAFGAMAGLLMAGKDRAAMRMLEKTMNKLVEKTDDGLHKKKTILGTLFAKFGKRDYTGEQSKGCFRAIQERYSKQVACDAMVLTKQLGFLSDKWSSAASDMESNTFDNGGMHQFLTNVGWPVANISSQIHKTNND